MFVYSTGNIFQSPGNATENIFYSPGYIFVLLKIFLHTENIFYSTGNIFPQGANLTLRGMTGPTLQPQGIIPSNSSDYHHFPFIWRLNKKKQLMTKKMCEHFVREKEDDGYLEIR